MTTAEPCTFGWDVIDALNTLRGYDGWAWDVIDVINEGRAIPTLCPECGEAWLMGPDALALGKCWHCRTNGGSA